MTDSSARTPRPVSLVAILAVLACFALFLLLIDVTYLRHRSDAPQNSAAEKLSSDQAWKATPAARQAYLDELRAKQQKQASSYAWVDRKAGIVQVPIDRAMELVAEQYGKK